jgi:sterol O-acyltransferase
MMKMHSYMAVNGYLQGVNERAIKTDRLLREKTEEIGGWDQAVVDAKMHREELEQTDGSTPSETPAVLRDGSKGYFSGHGPAATALRHRLQQIAKDDWNLTAHSNVHIASSVGVPVPKSIETKEAWTMPGPLPPHVLVDHPNRGVSVIAQQLSEMELELTGNCLHKVRYPANLTWWNYLDFHMLPTLVYELEYPRTDRYVLIAIAQLTAPH